MASIKRAITESKLNSALQRLLDRCPTRTKATGLLTLNKINKEAGLGNSYIHKFPEFIEFAKPLIDEYNASAEKQSVYDFTKPASLTAEQLLKVELNRERRLKARYRQERNDAKKAQATLEALNNILMYRIFELQEELKASTGVVDFTRPTSSW